MTISILIVPAVLLLLMLAFTIFAIVKFRGTARILAGVLGGLVTVVLGFATLVAIAIHSFAPSSFNPSTYKGPKGQVQLPYDCDVRLTASHIASRSSQKPTTYYKGERGLVTMPVGSYQVLTYTVDSPDGNGWNGDFYESARLITVKANEITQLKVGEPIVVSLRVEDDGAGKFIVMPDVRGCGGEQCSLTSLTGFEVLSLSGKMLMQGKFEFG